ncbi:transglutaminase-like domain-containing protein [Thermodesulfobacteriota bacterium]
MTIERLPAIIRVLILIFWIVLFGLLLQRDYFVKTLEVKETRILQKGKEESFLGIYFQRERIGYVKNRLTPADDSTVRLEQTALMQLNILDETHTIRMEVSAELTENLLLKNFIFTLSSPFYQMEADGEVRNNSVHFTLYNGKETISDVIRLNKPPYLSTNQRAYLLKQGLEKGDKIKIPYFDPISLSGKDTIMEYKGLEKKLIQGRIYNLHHFVESFSGVRINSWLDEEGKVIREESPAGFVFISEPEFKATAIPAKGKEILSAVSAPMIGDMPDISDRESLQFRLIFPEDAEFTLETDRQRYADRILTVKRESIPADSAAPCAGYEDELASTPYIQSKNKMIAKQVLSLVEENDPPMEKVRILSQWVFDNIEKRPVLGIPDALTTLSTRLGDCNEHAALFTALTRNAGIPARVAAGVTFHQGAFYYHAWNEVCIDDRWLSLDTTRNQIPADITHIKFIQGETQEMIRIGALLGKLKIEVISKEDDLEQ